MVYVPSGFSSADAACPPSVMSNTIPALTAAPPRVTFPDTVAVCALGFVQPLITNKHTKKAAPQRRDGTAIKLLPLAVSIERPSAARHRRAPSNSAAPAYRCFGPGKNNFRRPG